MAQAGINRPALVALLLRNCYDSITMGERWNPKHLVAATLAGIVLWTCSTAVAAGYGTGAARWLRSVVPGASSQGTGAGAEADAAARALADRAQRARAETLRRQEQAAERAELEHKFGVGRKMWAGRQARLEQARREAEARRRAEELRRQRAREEALRQARARAAAAAAARQAAAKKQTAKAASQSKSALVASLADVDLLARLIEIEAGGEPYEGKVAVGAVIVNRVRSSRFPDSIRAVIFAPGQFPTAAELIPKVRPGASEIRAAREALAGRDPSNGALYFYNPRQHRCDEGGGDFLCSLKVTARIGNHVFAR